MNAIGNPSVATTYTQGVEITPQPKIQSKVATMKEITAIRMANR